MLDKPIHFFLGFTLSFLPAVFLFSKTPTSTTTELENVAVSAQVESTTMATPTPSSTFKPTIKPIPIFEPTPTSAPTPTPEPTPTPDVWSPPHLEPWFAQFAGQYGVDKNILERLANCESHFDPDVVNGDYVGLFQFSTNTWVSYRTQIGADASPGLRTNAEESIRTAAYAVQQNGTSPWPACMR
ncbi:hypothetical protein C4564_03750 [Candidatus Microgenomates bacterium]|nr:MAG: hypothetical protein C4564_03750 [Candidatus Microgenomates bacterium]